MRTLQIASSLVNRPGGDDDLSRDLTRDTYVLLALPLSILAVPSTGLPVEPRSRDEAKLKASILTMTSIAHRADGRTWAADHETATGAGT
jgi:hypothetical protein